MIVEMEGVLNRALTDDDGTPLAKGQDPKYVAERAQQFRLQSITEKMRSEDLRAQVDTIYRNHWPDVEAALDTRDRKQARLAEQRKQLRADNLQTELLAAAVREESADTFPDGSSEFEQRLVEAANLYDGIYKNYRTRLAGRYARMYQGRCALGIDNLLRMVSWSGCSSVPHRSFLSQPNPKLPTSSPRSAC